MSLKFLTKTVKHFYLPVLVCFLAGIILLGSYKNSVVYAQINPGDSPQCITGCLNDWEGIHGCTAYECSQCSWCSEWAFGPKCDDSCNTRKAAGATNSFLCAQNECLGCDYCNSRSQIDFQESIDKYNKEGTLDSNAWLGEVLSGAAEWTRMKLAGPVNDKVDVGEPGLITGLGTSIASLYKHPPASTGEYLADVGQSFGLANPAYAQGTGFKSFTSILPMWKAARNVAYVFFILAFLVSGFAIMFRIKISPQAVVSIQNALPKMIIAMILVTFSYAIAGLLIDLSYVLLYLAVLAFGQTGWIDITREQAKLTNLNFWGGWGLIYGGSTKAIWAGVAGMFDSAFSGGPVIGGMLSGIVSAVLGVVGTLVFLIVALVLMFKLFFTLLTCYVQIIMQIVIGPILIAFGALPSSKDSFQKWLTNLTGNIMVFPATAFVMMVGNIMTSKLNAGGVWRPPLFGDRHDLVIPMMSFGILMLVTKVPEMVKSAFKIKDAGYGNAIGKAIFDPATQAIMDKTSGWASNRQGLKTAGSIGQTITKAYTGLGKQGGYFK